MRRSESSGSRGGARSDLAEHMLLPREFGALLAALNKAGLEYVVVGGVAVNLLGFQRTTQDVDVLVPATPEQGREIRSLLATLGATRPDGSPLPNVLFDGEHHVRALTKFGIVDFIPEGEATLAYAQVRDEAVADEIQGVPIWRASLKTIAELKRLANRPQDREDLDALRQAYGTLPGEDRG